MLCKDEPKLETFEQGKILHKQEFTCGKSMVWTKTFEKIQILHIQEFKCDKSKNQDNVGS